MNEKHVVLLCNKIVAIVESEALAKHFSSFLFNSSVSPLSNWDFNYGEIKAFMGE